MEKNGQKTGALVERGKVTGLTENGWAEISSYDRPGVGCCLPGGEALAEGDKVCFALFGDGTGFIFGKLDGYDN